MEGGADGQAAALLPPDTCPPSPRPRNVAIAAARIRRAARVPGVQRVADASLSPLFEPAHVVNVLDRATGAKRAVTSGRGCVPLLRAPDRGDDPQLSTPMDAPADPRRVETAPAPGDLRRLLLVLAVLLLPVAILLAAVFAWWWSNTTETFGPLAAGGGWIAFEQQVDHAWPLGDDRCVWLGRSVEDRSTWHRLAPTDAVRVQRFTWITPQHLRIVASRQPDPDWATQVEDITIEWVR
jgi:hypothetical protein